MWKAEVTACAFQADADTTADHTIARIADLIGLDGKAGEESNPDTRRRMERRLEPFLDPVAPGRVLKIDVPALVSSRDKYDGDHDNNDFGDFEQFELGPGDRSGVATEVLSLPVSVHKHIKDGQVIRATLHNFSPQVYMDIRFAVPEGWLVISDIDDTIKRTQTPDETGIVKTTFVEHATPIPHMPQLYSHIQNELSPTWFYLSASPYNLYTFLRQFLHSYYPKGSILLRNTSVSDPAGLAKTISENTYEFKTSQIEKIYDWLPRRKVLCIGDSTQKDPETYADMYSKFPGWIKAIFIRKVTDAPHMKDKNTPKRFDRAFRNVPPHVYKVFESPDELQQLVSGLGARGD